MRRITSDAAIAAAVGIAFGHGAVRVAGQPAVPIDHTGPGGHLTADVEGLAVHHAKGEKGYLIASSRDSSGFVVHDRVAHAHLLAFSIGAAPPIDAVTPTTRTTSWCRGT